MESKLIEKISDDRNQEIVIHAEPLVSDEELAQCIDILKRFHSDSGYTEFQKPRYKSLRTVLQPLHDELRKKFFGGQTLSAFTKRAQRKRARKIESSRQKALDQQFIQSTKLRADRLSNLEKLITENPLLPSVPDGVADSLPLLTLPSEAVNKGNEIEDNNSSNSEYEKTQRNGATLHFHRVCYTCKVKFRQLHVFYDHLCPECATLNFEKRHQTADLTDQIAIVTGGRVKIGYEIALKLLRAGAIVVVTTRFPKDAALRYARQQDSGKWNGRLHIYGMDFRDLGVVDQFMNHVNEIYGKVDILINNATQTIRRPVHYYKHLIEQECSNVPEPAQQYLRNQSLLMQSEGSYLHSAQNIETKDNIQTSDAISSISSSSQMSTSVLLSQTPFTNEDQITNSSALVFPNGQIDQNNQQIDLRQKNSWVMKIEDIDPIELVEVFAINAMTPFLLNKRVIPLLEKSTTKYKFIVNVSAMEGKFYRYKLPNHPHTNMAKAAVNMMTRTCAEDLASRSIYMNSVDTGWINDENPREVAQRIAIEKNFQTPLDEVDAASRVLDPIFMVYQEKYHHEPLFGQFLKDYKTTEW